MGGKGAKERRRLQRLVDSGADTSRTSWRDQISKTSSSFKRAEPERKQRREVNPGGQPNLARSRPFRVASTHVRNRSLRPPSARKVTTKPTTKEKVKKPKHLKRKLEQLGESNEKKKAMLMQTLHEFQQRKLTLSAQRAKVNKEAASAPSRLATDRASEESDIVTTPIQMMPSGNSRTSRETRTPPPRRVDHSDSESDVSLDEHTTRQRGRRRRGRQETSEKVAELQKVEQAEDSKVARLVSTPSSDQANPNVSEGPQLSATRRCIGRKPVTDFIVGDRYPGKVVYIKQFGVFIDIGCHSDAFCHVSRVRDEFVERINDVIQEGDQVHPRVVEISRKDKRVTVSLQSDARIEDEQASMKAKKKREVKRASSNRSVEDTAKEVDMRQESVAPQNDPERVSSRSREAEHVPVDEASMTAGELRRARKLARRAARRAQQEETGVSP